MANEMQVEEMRRKVSSLEGWDHRTIARFILYNIEKETERCAKIAETLCTHSANSHCEFGDAPKLIAKMIRHGS